MLVSREIITYRGSPYQGVRDYVESLRKVRKKLKRLQESTPNEQDEEGKHP